MDKRAVTLEDYLTIGAQLLTGWEGRASQSLVGTNRRPKTPQQLAMTFGLAAHTHETGAVALDLIDRGDVLVALPLVRTAYECAITAQWIAQHQGGATAALNEERRQRLNHAKVMLRSGRPQDELDAVTSVIAEDVETAWSARRFNGICDDLTPGGASAYVVYRLLSHLTHATVLVADQYLEATDVGSGLGLSLQPLTQPDAPTWAAIVACSFVWAGRAVDYMEKGSPRRSELRTAARRLGIQSELQLTPEAQVRPRTS